jgi:hypothetical protein
MSHRGVASLCSNASRRGSCWIHPERTSAENALDAASCQRYEQKAVVLKLGRNMKRYGYGPARICTAGLLLLALAAVQPALAQTATATLSGNITDENGRPLRDAKITVIGANNVSKVATTDNEGNYALSGLVAERVEVKVEAPRHKKRRYPGFLLEAGKTSTLNSQLSGEAMGGPRGDTGGDKYAVCADYVFFHVHESSFGESLNGFDGCFQAKVHNQIGVEVETGVVFHSQTGGSEHLFWFSGGPIYSFGAKDSKATPWVHAQIGFARDTFSSGSASSGENSFVFKLGGGVNVKMKRNIQWKTISFDYAPTHFSGNFQQNIEVRSGICFRFG